MGRGWWAGGRKLGKQKEKRNKGCEQGGTDMRSVGMRAKGRSESTGNVAFEEERQGVIA